MKVSRQTKISRRRRRQAGNRAAGGTVGIHPQALKKEFLAIEGHMDDAEIGMGGILIQAGRASHRVVIVTVASDLSTWGRDGWARGADQAGTDRLGQGLRFRKAIP
jgi:hypothetical protein